MIDNNIILTEDELPIPVPSTDEAWKAMLKKLEEDDPEPILIAGKSRNLLGWILGGLLLLFVILWFGWFSPVSKSNDPEGKAATVSKNEAEKNSTASSDPKSDAGKNEQNQNSIDNSENGSSETPTKNSNNNNLISSKSNFTDKSSIGKSSTNNNSQKSSSKSKNRKSGLNDFDNSNISTTDQADEDVIRSSPINYSLLSGGPIKKPLFPQMKISKKDEPEPAQNSYWLMEAGLEWGLPVPFSSARNIMDGPNGSFQPYRILLPGAWIRLEAGKHSMSLAVNPFYSALMPSKPFEYYDSVATGADTTKSYIESRNLNKTFGIAASFEYNYNLRDRWWIGAGIQANWWSNGLIALNSEVRKVPLNGSPAIVTNHTDERPITDEEWNNFSKSQIGLTAQFFYRKKPWDAGMRFVLPITPLANNEGPSNPFRAEFLFRIKLFDWRIRQ